VADLERNSTIHRIFAGAAAVAVCPYVFTSSARAAEWQPPIIA
jgi:hypothetical protein